jgi:hypothetical protein
LITDLNVGWSTVMVYNSGATIGVPLSFHFPLWIPSGASLGARIRFAHSSAPSNPARVVAVVAGGNKNPASWWCGQKVETIGTFNAAASLAQVIAPGTGQNITGAANNGSGLIRLTVASTTGYTTGDRCSVSSVNGTTEANGVWTITVIDSTHVDLQGSTFVNTFSSSTSSGLSSPWGSWTDLGSPTSARSGAVQWAAGFGSSGTTTISRDYEFQFGAGGAQIGPSVFKGISANEAVGTMLSTPIFCDIPAGTQLQARGRSSGSSPHSLDCAAYLVQ